MVLGEVEVKGVRAGGTFSKKNRCLRCRTSPPLHSGKSTCLIQFGSEHGGVPAPPCTWAPPAHRLQSTDFFGTPIDAKVGPRRPPPQGCLLSSTSVES